MEEGMLNFGIAFRDAQDNEYYATVYKAKVPTTLYAVHFYDQVTKDEYDVLAIGTVSGKLVTITHHNSSIADMSQLVADEILKYLAEIGEPVD